MQTIVTEPVRRVQVGQFAQALDRVEYLLRNCGYLAERKGDCVVLSDNAHWLDFRDLAPWLPFRADALEAFPWVRGFSRHGSESSELGPERFLERVHGYKFPACGLDGLLAYLVGGSSPAHFLELPVVRDRLSPERQL
jgi:hypothetical protein